MLKHAVLRLGPDIAINEASGAIPDITIGMIIPVTAKVAGIFFDLKSDGLLIKKAL